jgi:hypothetical protein
VAFSSSSTPQTFTYKNASAGSYSIAVTSADGGTISGSPISLTLSGGSKRRLRWYPGLVGCNRRSAPR